MKVDLNLWNIHYWLEIKNIPHLYSFDEELCCFFGIRFSAPEVDSETYAVLTNAEQNSQYHSVLSFQNSRLYFQTLGANEAMDILSQILSEYALWLKTLRSINLERKDLSVLLEAITDFLNCPFLIMKSNHPLSCTPGYDDLIHDFSKVYETLDLHALLEDAYSVHALPKLTYPQLAELDTENTLVIHRFPFHQNYIWILALDSHQVFTSNNLNLMETVSKLIEQNIIWCNKSTLLSHPNDIEHCFLSLVLNDAPQKIAAQYTLQKLHWQKDDNYIVYRIELPDYDDSLLLNTLFQKLILAFQNIYGIICDSGIYLFQNTSKGHAPLTEADFASLIHLSYVYIGQSNEHPGFYQLSQLIVQAKQAVYFGRQQQCHFLLAQTISTDYLCKKLYEHEELQNLIHPTILHLQQLDHARPQSFGYIETLKFFLLCGANLSQTAKALNIHRNTLINRIQKIQDLSNIDLQNTQNMEMLLLSILLSKDCNQ